MSELFDCSLDYLLKDAEETDRNNQSNSNKEILFFRKRLRERKSEKTVGGMLSMGVLSLGMFSVGLLSIGMFALGLLSAGCFSIGVFTTGTISLGIISIGAIAIGDFSVGALSIGKYFALGDNARAMIALGDTEAAGSVFQKIGELSAQDITAVQQPLDTVVPAYLSWAKEIIKLFV